MNKKSGIIVLCVVSGIILGILLYQNANKAFSSFIVMGCTAIEYVQEDDAGYLTIVQNRENAGKIVVPVKDSALQQKVAEHKLDEVIGVNLLLEIPANIARKHKLEQRTNPFDLLESGGYEEYLILQDIFYENADN